MGRLQVARFLVEKAANVRAREGEAIGRAASGGFIRLVHMLIEWGARGDVGVDYGMWWGGIPWALGRCWNAGGAAVQAVGLEG